MSAYYNEINTKKAAWLRELIKRNLIEPGDVDERSLKDVRADDLRGYVQCHFFAGIGVWSYALRQAGWPGDREVWTGSCPCQSFSVAGKKKGFADERHLWPDWFRLIAERRPSVIFGEQSASKDALTWLDLVYSDLENADYAVGALDICAAGFGAPHIRQRLYFVGELDYPASEGLSLRAGEAVPGEKARYVNQRSGDAGILEHATSNGREQRRPEPSGRSAEPRCGAGKLGDTYGAGLERRAGEQADNARQLAPAERTGGSVGGADPTNGFWRDADWLRCTDGKWRPVRSGSFPLAHGAPARMGRLRGYGDAIVAAQAQAFIEAYEEARMIDLRPDQEIKTRPPIPEYLRSREGEVWTACDTDAVLARMQQIIKTYGEIIARLRDGRIK